MTKALKIDKSDLDNFVSTLLMDHVDPSSHQLLWNNYKEFKGNYESIIIEDPKEMEKQVQHYKEKG